MKKISVIVLLSISIFFAGCIPDPPQATPQPLENLVALALTETQTAADNIPPAFPYLPAELALLVDPGEQMGGGWITSTVYDLSQPYPPLGDMCGGYYGGCAEGFPEILFGAEVELLKDGDQLGEVVFIYTEDPEDWDALYENYISRYANYDDLPANEIWLNYFNPYQREDLGEKWFHLVGYSLFQLPESTEENRVERELLWIRISVFECHGFLSLSAQFIPEHPWNSPEDNQSARLAEQEAKFDLVYAFAQELSQRITPYACNP